MKTTKDIKFPVYQTYGEILEEVEKLSTRKPNTRKTEVWDFYLYDNHKTTSIISEGKEIMTARNDNKEDLEDLKNAAKQCRR